MTLATVIVLPDPVTPRSVWNRSPRSTPLNSSAIARGWSPAGWKGAWRWKVAAMVRNIYAAAGFRSGPRPADLGPRPALGGPSAEGRGRLLLARDPLPPRHLGDPLHPPRGLHDLLEVRQVLDLHEDRPRHAAVHRVELHALDVRPGGADRRGDVGVEAAAVVAVELEAHHEALPLLLLPVDLEPPLRLVRQEQQVRAVRPVDAHPAPARHVAH